MILDSSVSKNFFGRDNMIDVLYRTVSAAKNGAAESVLLSGKRGIGKTKLLANLYNMVFDRQDGVIPFFYTVKKQFITGEDFANDYIGSFVLQGLAFQGKDPAVLSGIYSLEELREGAREFGAQWAVDIIDSYLTTREDGIETRTVLDALSAPYRSFKITGVPVLVIIDDLNSIRRFCEPKGKDITPGFWMPFEASISCMHVPHIFSGVPHEIEKVYFEEALMADRFEMIDLPGLDDESAAKLFRAACEMYGMKVEVDPSEFVGMFDGNPFYIKNFLQAARHAGGVLSKEVMEKTYLRETSGGKTYKYWTFLLKRYIKHLDLRKPSLGMLYGYSNGGGEGMPDLDEDVLDRISELLHDSGSIETGFSETMPADNVLRDVVKSLYHREVGESPSSDADHDTDKPAASDEVKAPVDIGTASFVITVPADINAGIVAIKSFEQVARNYNIPLKAVEKLQLAMADLFSNVFSGDTSVDAYTLQVKGAENSFSIEITTPRKDFEFSDKDSARIRAYLDDLKVEAGDKGTVITLVKDVKGDFIPPEGG